MVKATEHCVKVSIVEIVSFFNKRAFINGKKRGVTHS